ncbi:hypothetical protein ACWIGM_05320 [Bosea sp. NPDC055332]
MYTDAGLFTNDGTVSAILSKAYCLPHLCAVISSRGSCYFANQLILAINHSFSTFEGLIGGLSAVFRTQYETHESTIALAGASFELWLAGWSHVRKAPESYAIASHGLTVHHHGVSAAPWEITRLNNRSIVPRDAKFDRRLAAYSIETPEELGIAVAECQRQLRGTTPHGVEITGLAGFIQHSTVNRDGISTRILKRFPDEVGKHVAPSPEIIV